MNTIIIGGITELSECINDTKIDKVKGIDAKDILTTKEIRELSSIFDEPLDYPMGTEIILTFESITEEQMKAIISSAIKIGKKVSVTTKRGD